jgi:hypothetical protein
MSCVIAGDRGIAALQFAGDLSYHQCSIFLPSLGPIRAVGGGERLLCVGSWMGCVAEVAEPRASPRHRPVGPALCCVGLWAQSRPSAHIRACCRACGASADVIAWWIQSFQPFDNSFNPAVNECSLYKGACDDYLADPQVVFGDSVVG